MKKAILLIVAIGLSCAVMAQSKSKKAKADQPAKTIAPATTAKTIWYMPFDDQVLVFIDRTTSKCDSVILNSSIPTNQALPIVNYLNQMRQSFISERNSQKKVQDSLASIKKTVPDSTKKLTAKTN